MATTGICLIPGVFSTGVSQITLVCFVFQSLYCFFLIIHTINRFLISVFMGMFESNLLSLNSKKKKKNLLSLADLVWDFLGVFLFF